MREYLLNFLRDYEYEPEDIDYLISTYDKVMADKEAAEMWNSAIAMYEENIECTYSKITETADKVGEILCLHEFTLEFLIFACLSKHTAKVYKERGISEEIYKNTMMDLRDKLDECKMVKGVVGIFVPYWFYGFFALKRFAIGRLQFELKPFGRNYEKDGKVLNEESIVIDTHIPRGRTPLNEEECEKAYKQAAEFFKDQLNGECAFVCDSWFLFPENKTIMSPNSNIYKFMSRYDVIESKIDKNRGLLWRVFGTEEKNLSRLTATNSLQRAYLEHAKAGGKLGTGYGVFFYP